MKATKIVCMALTAIAALVLEAETVGLWLFNGADGTPVSEVVPNLVPNSPVVLRTVITNPNGGNGTDLPKYSTHGVPAPYLFSDAAYTNLIASPTSVGVMQSGCTSSGTAWRSAYLAITNLAEALDGDWTVEVIARVDIRQAWCNMITLATATNTPSGWSDELLLNQWFLQDAAGFNTGIKQLNNNNRRCWPAFVRTGAKTQVEGEWGHYAMRYSKSADRFYMYGNGVMVSDKESWKEMLGSNASDFVNEKTVLSLFNQPNMIRDAEIYAVRLTKGYLPSSKFMTYLDATIPPDTVAHWRFERDGATDSCSYVRNEGFQSFNNALVTNGKVYTNDVWRPYIRNDGALLKNRWAYSADMSESPTSTTPTMELFCYSRDIVYPRNMTVELMFRYHDPSRERQNILGMSNEKGKVNSVNDDGISWRFALNYDKLVFDFVSCTNGVDAKLYRLFTQTISSNEWHHAAIVCNDDEGKIDYYLDYARVGGGTYSLLDETRITECREPTTQQEQKSIAMRTGTAFNYNFGFAGAIDEIRISRRALAPEEFLKGACPPGLTIFVR